MAVSRDFILAEIRRTAEAGTLRSHGLYRASTGSFGTMTPSAFWPLTADVRRTAKRAAWAATIGGGLIATRAFAQMYELRRAVEHFCTTLMRQGQSTEPIDCFGWPPVARALLAGAVAGLVYGLLVFGFLMLVAVVWRRTRAAIRVHRGGVASVDGGMTHGQASIIIALLAVLAVGPALHMARTIAYGVQDALNGPCPPNMVVWVGPTPAPTPTPTAPTAPVLVGGIDWPPFGPPDPLTTMNDGTTVCISQP